MDQEIASRFKDIEYQLNRTNDKLEDFEKRMYSAETNIQLLKTKLDDIQADTKDIRADIKEIRKLREDDHFQKPLENVDKLKFQIVGVVIGILFTSFIMYLFPHIGR